MYLNKEVAEKVMGFKAFYNIREELITDRTCYFPGGDKFRIWNPLENLNQCFEVVEKLRGKELLIDLYHQLRQPDGSYLYWCQFESENQDVDLIGAAHGKTPNEAILKAALETLKT